MVRAADILTEMQNYMASTLHQDTKYNTVRRSCRNYDPYCAAYAAVGFCDDKFHDGEEYPWMITYCAPACLACEEYEIVQPCEANPAFNYYNDGDLSKMFERMIGERKSETPLPDYKPVIHSRPGGSSGDDNSGDLVDGPWVITLENFLTDEECDRLKDLGKLEGYARSELQNGEDDEDEEWRTSSNAWCEEECQSDPIAQRVIRRIGQRTGIPHQYSESLQLLRYSPGQFYSEHHDNSDSSFGIDEGARMITFFLYLNDVEEGGATRLTDLHYDGEDGYPGEDKNRTLTPLVIRPKKGMALVWPNINDEDHAYKEERTWHEALPVVKGLKYGANAWFRQRRLKSLCDEDSYYEWQRSHNLVDAHEREEEEEMSKKEASGETKVEKEKEYNVAVLEDDYSLIPDE